MNDEPSPVKRTCRFIAFYSYKGGVGRTLALVNTARALMLRGKHVVVMDLDLGAPGLHHFPVFWPKGGKAQCPRLKGFVEYLDTCHHQGPPESLESFIHPCRGKPQDKGRAWIMPAGLHGEAHYLEILNDMSWERFYREEDGFRIIENLRGHIMAEFQPDYVLMDAQPGLSETGVIATHQLADVVVLIFNLNQQNLEGAKRIHDSLCHLPSPPLILLVASPIPIVPVEQGTPFSKKMDWIREHLAKAENAQMPLLIPYQATLAFEDRILIDDHGDPFLSDQAYRRLVTAIQKTVLVDADIFLDRAACCWREGRLAEAEQILAQGLRHNPDHPQLLNRLACLRLASDLIQREGLASAMEDLQRALQLTPGDYDLE